MIAGTGYIKSANDESLARDEGGGRNLFMEVVTYKPVQGRQLRMTAATATFFPCPWMQRQAPKGSTRAPTTFKLQEYHETSSVRPADLIDNYQIRRVWVDVRSRCR